MHQQEKDHSETHDLIYYCIQAKENSLEALEMFVMALMDLLGLVEMEGSILQHLVEVVAILVAVVQEFQAVTINVEEEALLTYLGFQVATKRN